MKRDCIFCRGTMSHRNNARKADMCPAAYAAKRRRQRTMWHRQSWITTEGKRMRQAARTREARLNV